MKYGENLSAFQKLLLLRCFRIDRVYRAVTDYITVTMGERWGCHSRWNYWNTDKVLHVSCTLFLLRYVQPPVINFDAIYEQSTPFSPIVFILSPGSDPGSDLMKLSERLGFRDKFKFLAMGQGQEKVLMTFSPFHRGGALSVLRWNEYRHCNMIVLTIQTRA